jgi:uncharacterized membrane protein YhaH (DUF805 family)
VGFSEAVGSCFSKYVTFSGRAVRSEFWYFALFQILANLVASTVDYSLGVNIVGPLFDIVVALPALAVAVRRLHDIDKSGWWVLLWFVPIIGWLFLLIWHCTKGTLGPNRFGPDPLPTPFGAPA